MESDPTKKTNGNEDESLEDSLEIEMVENPSNGKDYLRKDFRYLVEDLEDCWVSIEGKTYGLYDVSKSGLGISSQADVVFGIGECFGDILKDCTVNVLGHTISGMDYKMIHISPHKEDRMICGLNWVNPAPDTLEAMESAIQALNDRTFSADEFDNE